MRPSIRRLPQPKSYAMNGQTVYPIAEAIINNLTTDVFAMAYTITEPPSWVVLSVFSLVGLFFVFYRFWSLRNLDILLILSFIPGFMLVYEGQQEAELLAAGSVFNDSTKDTTDLDPTRETAKSPAPEAALAESPAGILARAKLVWGFLALLVCSGLLTLRMLWDTGIVRRPKLEPNLNSGGMLFIGISLLVFLIVNIALSTPRPRSLGSSSTGIVSGAGPGNVLIRSIPSIETMQSARDSESRSGVGSVPVAQATPPAFNALLPRILAIGANVILIVSIVGIGYWHFGSFNTGVGTATLYLLLPYTAHTAGSVDHVVPGSLLLLAMLMYRQPFLAGMFLGLAAGVVYYPFFLLPLWCSFYWQRGVRRFGLGFAFSIAMLILAIALSRQGDFLVNLGYMFGIKHVEMQGLGGIWGLGWHPLVRIPIIVVFVILSLSFVVWPAQKNLATLMSCSAALMAAAQFWHGFGGGLFLAWFLPFAILTIFRPNLDYCVALEVVVPWRRRPKTPQKEEPASQPLAAA
ncbi:MAG: hypothetical protein NTV29_16885 [Planctomycetota bacterium]|nr:hypothetical protein [Planctomycetota bacterium]